MNKKELIEYERQAWLNAIDRALIRLYREELMGMGPIATLNKYEIKGFMEQVRYAQEHEGIFEVRFAINGGGLKWSINAATWSPAIGEVKIPERDNG